MGLVSISSCGDKNRKAGIRALTWAWEEITDDSWEREKDKHSTAHLRFTRINPKFLSARRTVINPWFYQETAGNECVSSHTSNKAMCFLSYCWLFSAAASLLLMKGLLSFGLLSPAWNRQPQSGAAHTHHGCGLALHPVPRVGHAEQRKCS